MRTTETLTDGLKVGEDTYKDVVLQTLTGQHMIDADAAAERVVETSKGPVLVKSPSRMTYELLRRAIASIGPIQGPISLAELGKLSVRDLGFLEEKAFEHQELTVSAAVEASGR